MRVLLVEDNLLNIELFRAVLEADGHDLSIAADAATGRDRALAEPFDLILLDIQLPGASGIELCRELRGSGLTGPIVALSSAALPDQVALGLAAGFDEYLTKPISPAALRAAVRSHRGTRTSR